MLPLFRNQQLKQRTTRTTTTRTRSQTLSHQTSAADSVKKKIIGRVSYFNQRLKVICLPSNVQHRFSGIKVRYPRTIKSIMVMFLLLCTILLIGTEHRTHELIETAEMWLKNGVIHRIQNEWFQESLHLPPLNHTKIFFLHIPRTAGDSIRTDLFGVDKPWTLDYSGWATHEMPFNMTRNQSIEEVHASWAEPRVQIIKGHFGFHDINSFQFTGTKKIFTILRHPVERVLSFYKFASKGNCDRLKRLFPGLQNRTSCPNITEFVREHGGHPLVSNYMVWQFGASNDALNVQLESAKQRLSMNVDFIGFYEDLWTDFELLHQEIFPHVQGGDAARFVFNAGTVFGYPRLRTMKYSKHTPSEALSIIADQNKYDMMLYEWALRYKKKTFTLHSSYAAMFGLG